MSDRKLVIIESPYAGNIEQNTLYARHAMKHSIHMGESPIASHLIYTQPGILRDHDPMERQIGIACGLAWSRVAELHAFYTDLGWSKGMIDAYEFCEETNKPYEFRAFGHVRHPSEYYAQIEEKKL